ncbi:MAG: AMP-binding protein [Sulfurovum sp.]|nr:AMP-binding protein [Sulfurovum sp.]
MNLNILNDDGIVKQYPIVKENFVNEALKNRVGYIGTQSKEENALNIFKAYFSESKAILLDETNQAIAKQLSTLNVPNFPSVPKQKTVFDEEAYALTYFTSGSTGHPIAALKTKTNLESEVNALTKLLTKYNIKKVVVTVPFIHLYGTLLGLIYPLLNKLDIVLKEHFLPHDLLNVIDEHTMVVTTPLYIRALNKLSEKKDLSTSVFISSTAALALPDIELFRDKYSADIMQIFGSTETGGIAYKFNDERLWKPFEGVKLSTNAANELKVQSPFISTRLYENGFKQTHGEIQTFDYVELEEEGFKLIGRSSKIFKIAGKRYSTIQIEHILETVKGIEKALVFTELGKDVLRGEYLDITIESKEIYTVKEIKKLLQKELSNLKFVIKLHIVDKIPTNQVGKKLRIL